MGNLFWFKLARVNRKSTVDAACKEEGLNNVTKHFNFLVLIMIFLVFKKITIFVINLKT